MIRASWVIKLITFVAVAFSASGTLLWIKGATLPAGFTETSTSGLSGPTAMDFASDGRLFVCLQSGSLRVIKNGALLVRLF